jgi:hypothetical protein
LADHVRGFLVRRLRAGRHRSAPARLWTIGAVTDSENIEIAEPRDALQPRRAAAYDDDAV